MLVILVLRRGLRRIDLHGLLLLECDPFGRELEWRDDLLLLLRLLLLLLHRRRRRWLTISLYDLLHLSGEGPYVEAEELVTQVGNRSSEKPDLLQSSRVLLLHPG